MTLVLYGDSFSVATRLVTCTLECLGLKYEFKHVDVRKGEHLAPSYQKINPLQSVPMLVDGSFKLTESRAIAMYLVDQYAKNDDLYPKIPLDRARVNEMLFYDGNTVSKRYQELMSPVLLGDHMDEEAQNRMMALLHFLSKKLGSTSFGYMANTDNMTIADLAIFATISTIEAVGVLDLEMYVDLSTWLRNCEKQIPNYDNANGRGLNKVVQFVQSSLAR